MVIKCVWISVKGGDIIMINKRFVTFEEVQEDFGVSRTKAYELIKQLNEELEQAGYLIVRGRVSRKYYLERTYGGIESEVSQ